MNDVNQNDGVSSLVLDIGTQPTALTGTLVETTILETMIPALPDNALLRFYALLSWTNNANNKIVRLKYDDGLIAGPTYTTVGGAGLGVALFNRGQTQIALNSTNWFGSTTLLTTSKDSAQPRSLKLTGQLANVGDVLTVESYVVELLGYRAP